MISLGRLGAACQTVSSSSFDTSKWVRVKDSTESPYYNATCKCWSPGYKPDQWSLQGLTPNFNDKTYQQGNPWLVCVPQPPPPAPKPVSPPVTNCPVCKTCPAPVTCPSCPTCPACGSNTAITQPDAGKSAYGPTLGIVLAVVVIGGGGYYAYKKGAFGGKKKRR